MPKELTWEYELTSDDWELKDGESLVATLRPTGNEQPDPRSSMRKTLREWAIYNRAGAFVCTRWNFRDAQSVAHGMVTNA